MCSNSAVILLHSPIALRYCIWYYEIPLETLIILVQKPIAVKNMTKNEGKKVIRLN